MSTSTSTSTDAPAVADYDPDALAGDDAAERYGAITRWRTADRVRVGQLITWRVEDAGARWAVLREVTTGSYGTIEMRLDEVIGQSWSRDGVCRLVPDEWRRQGQIVGMTVPASTPIGHVQIVRMP